MACAGSYSTGTIWSISCKHFSIFFFPMCAHTNTHAHTSDEGSVPRLGECDSCFSPHPPTRNYLPTQTPVQAYPCPGPDESASSTEQTLDLYRHCPSLPHSFSQTQTSTQHTTLWEIQSSTLARPMIHCPKGTNATDPGRKITRDGMDTMLIHGQSAKVSVKTRMLPCISTCLGSLGVTELKGQPCSWEEGMNC